MTNAIILHGRPGKKEYFDGKQASASNSHWLPWLQNQLMTKGIKADTPEAPDAFEPQYDVWVKEVERFDINEESILVGHSTGGGFWIRYLSEHPKLKVNKVILVAPWLNVGRADDTDFFDFELRPTVINQANSFTIFSSDNDMQMIQDTVQFLHDKLPAAQVIEFHKYGHFTLSDMKTDQFPELLEQCIS